MTYAGISQKRLVFQVPMCYNTKGHNYNHENRQEPVSHFCGMKQALRKAGERNMSEKWVTAWGNAISVAERRPENYAKDMEIHV